MSPDDVRYIECQAEETLRSYGDRVAPVTFPVPVDLIGECLYGLEWDWETIPEPPGVQIWAGLYSRERRAVLNEAHKEMFDANEGIERFTKAHEIGHWLLHVNHDRLAHPALPGIGDEQVIFTRDGDDSEIELQANAFAAALLMPRDRIIESIAEIDLSVWPSIYKLRETFGVSISAMTMRLAKLNLAFFDAGSKIYRNYDDFAGQQALFD